MVRCAYCGARVEGNYREVTGWEKLRRGKGGLNRLVARVETGRHACDSCGYDLVHGIDPNSGQARLLDLDNIDRSVDR